MSSPFLLHCILFFLFSFGNIFLFFSSSYEEIPSHKTSLLCFDISLGDSCLLSLPKDRHFLIDTSISGKEIRKKLHSVFLEKEKVLEGVFITHADSDHIGGLSEIINEFTVQNLFVPQGITRDKNFINLLPLIEEKNIPIFFLEKNRDLLLSENIYFITLSSFFEERDTNQNSLIFVIKGFENDLLFLGDIEKQQEFEIMQNGFSFKSPLVKIAHHGSQTSSLPDFFHIIQPSLALISASKENRYNHPSEKTLETLQFFNIPYKQTGISGDIHICFDEFFKETVCVR
jgi:competence protein ComEC